MVLLQGSRVVRFLVSEVPLQAVTRQALPAARGSLPSWVSSSRIRTGVGPTSLIRNGPLLGPYIRTMPSALWWPWGGGSFL